MVIELDNFWKAKTVCGIRELLLVIRIRAKKSVRNQLSRIDMNQMN